MVFSLFLHAAVESPLGPLSLAAAFVVLCLQFAQIVVEPVEAPLPELAVVLDPVGDLLERLGLQPAGAPLCVAATGDQPRLLPHPEMLGNRPKAPGERLCDVPHPRLRARP